MHILYWLLSSLYEFGSLSNNYFFFGCIFFLIIPIISLYINSFNSLGEAIVNIFFTASQHAITRSKSVISFSLLLVFMSFNLLTLVYAAKYLIYVSICSSLPIIAKTIIIHIIVMICISCCVDVDWLIPSARCELILGYCFYGCI